MAETQDQPDELAGMKVKKLRCRRTGQMFSVAEHVQCPYCFSDAEMIEKGQDYEKFCEFKAGEDPVNFGFPPDSSRTNKG